MENLKDTIFKFLRLDGLMGSLTGYIETQILLFKLEIREDIAKAISKAIVFFALLLFGFLFLLFFSLGLAHYINVFFDEVYVGYWIVAGIYGVAFLLFLMFRKAIDRSFEKHFLEIIKRKDK
jgi:fatty acid desaturase